VNTVTVNLSSIQDPGDIVMYNHYWFSDPLSGTNIAYPVTANGDFFTYSTTPTVTADDGLFFPWGYLFDDTFETIYAGKYKGLTTLNVNASGLSTAYFPILRIYYEFGDGTVYNNSRNVLIDYSKLAIDSFINGYGYGDPKFIPVQHTYQPSDTTFNVTYTAHVQVFNGSLVTNNFYIIIDIVQDSIFDFDDINLLDTKFISLSEKTIINVLEASNPEYILNNLLKYSNT
jgi:hypothetical protein